MAAGFIYVLVNSSMPGYVKIGKTTRSPEERARELSAVTSVPTPFIVAFEHHYADCDAAEKHLHAELTRLGLRISDAREFFRASVSDIVKVMNAMPLGFRETYPAFSGRRNEFMHGVSGESAPKKKTPESAEAAERRRNGEELVREASRYRFGCDGYSIDPEEAYRLYLEATRFGSSKAFEYLGTMCLQSECGSAKYENASRYLQEGAALGNHDCHLLLAMISIKEENLSRCHERVLSFMNGVEKDLGYSPGGSSGPHNILIVQFLSELSMNEAIESKEKIRLFLTFRPYWPRIQETVRDLKDEDATEPSMEDLWASSVSQIIDLLNEMPQSVAKQFTS